jgi:hypothetical protein
VLRSDKYFVGRRVCLSNKYFVFKLAFIRRAKNSEYLNICGNIKVRQTCCAELQFRAVVSEVK